MQLVELLKKEVDTMVWGLRVHLPWLGPWVLLDYFWLQRPITFPWGSLTVPQ